MPRRLAWVALALACCLALAGCGDSQDTAGDDGGSTTSTPVATTGVSAEGLEPIPTNGPGESAALVALPAALEQGRQEAATAGEPWPDLTGAKPILQAYLVRVTMGDEAALLEVRADGTPHNLHAYQKAFDAGSLLWVPEDDLQTSTAAPQSDAEKAAVAAVEEDMADAFPDEALETAVHGYRFVYVRDEMIVLTVEIDPAGGVISVGS